jgi:hypothetical protein
LRERQHPVVATAPSGVAETLAAVEARVEDKQVPEAGKPDATGSGVSMAG